jgi:cold shock CspA family protein
VRWFIPDKGSGFLAASGQGPERLRADQVSAF